MYFLQIPLSSLKNAERTTLVLSDHRRSECDEANPQQENSPFKSLCTEPCWCHTHAGIDIHARVIDIVSKTDILFFLWRDFFFSLGATIFSLARLFFPWRDFVFLGHRFFILARLFFSFYIRFQIYCGLKYVQ